MSENLKHAEAVNALIGDMFAASMTYDEVMRAVDEKFGDGAVLNALRTFATKLHNAQSELNSLRPVVLYKTYVAVPVTVQGRLPEEAEARAKVLVSAMLLGAKPTMLPGESVDCERLGVNFRTSETAPVNA